MADIGKVYLCGWAERERGRKTALFKRQEELKAGIANPNAYGKSNLKGRQQGGKASWEAEHT